MRLRLCRARQGLRRKRRLPETGRTQRKDQGDGSRIHQAGLRYHLHRAQRAVFVIAKVFRLLASAEIDAIMAWKHRGHPCHNVNVLQAESGCDADRIVDQGRPVRDARHAQARRI